MNLSWVRYLFHLVRVRYLFHLVPIPLWFVYWLIYVYLCFHLCRAPAIEGVWDPPRLTSHPRRSAWSHQLCPRLSAGGPQEGGRRSVQVPWRGQGTKGQWENGPSFLGVHCPVHVHVRLRGEKCPILKKNHIFLMVPYTPKFSRRTIFADCSFQTVHRNNFCESRVSSI